MAISNCCSTLSLLRKIATFSKRLRMPRRSGSQGRLHGVLERLFGGEAFEALQQLAAAIENDSHRIVIELESFGNFVRTQSYRILHRVLGEEGFHFRRRVVVVHG